MKLKSGVDDVSKEGYFSLSWEGEVAESVRLEMASSENFEAIERKYMINRDGKITLSGYGDGTFYFRLRDSKSNEVSNFVVVNVEHWPLDKAVTFFFVGLTLFVCLISTLLVCTRIKKTD
ncbi:hypothetical protein [Pleionea sediminis]|uniref:hypothetical protein n=1 Tax=Pleionea sediminis TaxID=2569479 RepID=UPI001185BD2E|nr:hypothetical protein [Pleionea sediminis]